MILTEYLLSEKNASWVLADQMGIKHATVRLPEDKGFDAIKRTLNIVKSSNLGVIFCQATFSTMGEDLEKIVPELARENKIFFIHFRNVIGDKNKFRETFHDNGRIDMNKMIQLYGDCGCNVPIKSSAPSF